jgi:hypothetical protein
MKKLSVVILIFLVSLTVILFQTAFGTTFRVDGTGDQSILIRVVENESSSGGQDSSSGGGGGGHPPTAPILDAEGNCLNCICANCHKRKPIKVSAEKTVRDHINIYWPKNEYRLNEGQRVQVLTSDAYVVRRKGRLVLYDKNKPRLLSSRAKIIKAGRKFFILE